MQQISSSKQAAYLVRTTNEIALVGTGSHAHRAAASMARRPTRMPSDGSARVRDTLPCGGCPAPLESPDGRPGETRRLSAPRGTMERFDRRLHVRVGQADIERAQTLAGALDITTSALVRLLLQLPAKDVAARRHVVLDLTCANRLYRELNQWGYQQNQADHALNRITYYLRREAMDASDVLEELASVERQLERLRERTDELAAPVREVAESRLLFL